MGGAGGIGRHRAGLGLASRGASCRHRGLRLSADSRRNSGRRELAVHRFDLESGDFSFFERFVQGDTDGLFITAASVACPFEELDEAYIERSFTSE